MPAELLPAAETDAAVTVLAESFRDYPVMRYVLGDGANYGRRLLTLVGFFVAARVLRQEPVLGVRDGAGQIAAAAIVTLPRSAPEPEALTRRREVVWAELGAGARARYEAYGDTCRQFTIQEPHHHLNMIGVRPAHTGRGLARLLLDTVQSLAQEDADSAGVSLTTETSRNVPFYQHFGYRLLGRARIAEGLDTWGFFRERHG
jgi:GNAT superfamily N-acetyltransferase